MIEIGPVSRHSPLARLGTSLFSIPVVWWCPEGWGHDLRVKSPRGSGQDIMRNRPHEKWQRKRQYINDVTAQRLLCFHACAFLLDANPHCSHSNFGCLIYSKGPLQQIFICKKRRIIPNKYGPILGLTRSQIGDPPSFAVCTTLFYATACWHQDWEERHGYHFSCQFLKFGTA